MTSGCLRCQDETVVDINKLAQDSSQSNGHGDAADDGPKSSLPFEQMGMSFSHGAHASLAEHHWSARSRGWTALHSRTLCEPQVTPWQGYRCCASDAMKHSTQSERDQGDDSPAVSTDAYARAVDASSFACDPLSDLGIAPQSGTASMFRRARTCPKQREGAEGKPRLNLLCVRLLPRLAWHHVHPYRMLTPLSSPGLGSS